MQRSKLLLLIPIAAAVAFATAADAASSNPEDREASPLEIASRPQVHSWRGNSIEASAVTQGSRSSVRQLVNEYRRKYGLRPLTSSGRLNSIAQDHAEHMADANFFSHHSPDGRDLGDRLASGGASYSRAGENIARGHESAASVVNAWIASPGHRKNILNPDFRRLGVGISDRHWVQVFTD